MKKDYAIAEIEIIKIDVCDVIATSGGGTVDPGYNGENPFGGGYDPGGWT